MCKISIIVPVYNVEKYLAECLDSIRSQSFTDYEIICVDDASTDASLSVLKAYAERDLRIQILVNEENRGLSYTRNRGLDVARGKYILFVDSDDMLKPEALEKLYQYAKRERVDGVLFDREIKLEGNAAREKLENVKLEKEKLLPEQIFSGKELFIKFTEVKHWKVAAWRYFWNRDFLMKNSLRFYTGLINEDNLFTFQCLMKAAYIANLNEILYIYRKRDNSIMYQMNYHYLESAFVIFNEIFYDWKNQDYDEQTSVAIERYLNYLFEQMFLKRRRFFSEYHELSMGNFADKYLFKLFFERFMSDRKYAFLSEEKIAQLKRAQKVVVYGAGNVGTETIELLEENGIRIHAVAVTDKKNNMTVVKSYNIYGIEELCAINKCSIVIVAVVERHYDSILKKLKELGFDNIMFLDKRIEC